MDLLHFKKVIHLHIEFSKRVNSNLRGERGKFRNFDYLDSKKHDFKIKDLNCHIN